MSLIGRIISKVKGNKSEKILNNLRRGGASIGKKVMIYTPDSVDIDDSRPWLLEIGAYTKITRGVVILTHDYSLSVIRRVYGEWIGEGAKTSIGENCFLGANSVILMGTTIGNNVIVGAGSVVHGEIPSNVVIAGNPARVICSLEEYRKKRQERTVNEAIQCAKIFKERHNRSPLPSDLNGFKFLFTPRDKDTVEKYGIQFACTGDETEEVIDAFYNSVPYWNDFEEFLKDAGI